MVTEILTTASVFTNVDTLMSSPKYAPNFTNAVSIIKSGYGGWFVVYFL